MSNKPRWTNKQKAIQRLIDMHEFNGDTRNADRIRSKLKGTK